MNKNPFERKDREIRLLDLALKAREEAQNVDDAFFHVEGKPVTFGEETILYPGSMTGLGYDIREVIEPNSFEGTDMSDVVLNVNHGDGNFAVARTRNKSLELEVREDGVYFKAKLPKDNERCAQFYKDVRDGLLDRMSFAFTTSQEAYDEDNHTFHVQKVRKLYDVSAVEFPAYDNTSISAVRSVDLEKLKEELESRKNAVEVEKKRQALLDKIKGLLKIDSGESH